MKGIVINDNHDLQISIMRDKNGLITQGLVIGDITFQNQEIIIVSEKGEIKNAPTKGVGIQSYLDDEMPDNLLRAIRTELAVEGMQVNKVSINEKGLLEVDAKYKTN
jgi:hypothetical protein